MLYSSAVKVSSFKQFLIMDLSVCLLSFNNSLFFIINLVFLWLSCLQNIPTPPVMIPKELNNIPIGIVVTVSKVTKAELWDAKFVV
jgi:hypothetical protein